MTLRVGIDTGGTFTDLVVFDDRSQALAFHKVGSTPDDPARAIINGLQEVCAARQVLPDQVHLLVHGTTVATNTVLQNNGAKIALITTEGFRDVLHIQRQDRPRMYDLRSRRSRPLVPRQRRYELTERVLFDGSVRAPVDRVQLAEIVDELRCLKVEAVAIGFLHSYANAEHEIEVGKLVGDALQDVTVCLSHEIAAEQGEYERFSTCVMNAFVQPVLARYLRRLERALQESDAGTSPLIMKSNGGVMTASAAARQAVETILSGPAGGVVAGMAVAHAHANPNLITADMGGTSFDVAVIHDRQPPMGRESEIGGLALHTPMLDIHTIGAGGGSIAWIDNGGALRVGPQSAGAAPGPACYSRGGWQPTVTDANLVLGRLATSSLLAGNMSLDEEAAHRAVYDQIAAPLELSTEAAAEGIVRVVNAAMTAAIRKLTVERGYDPRDFVLCPFGGAGPLHGAELAAGLGIGETLVPVAPGVMSACGLLMSSLREDRARSYVAVLNDSTLPTIVQLLGELVDEALDRVDKIQGAGEILTRRSLGLRYRGQRYDLPVEMPRGEIVTEPILRAFHSEHERAYGYSRTDQPIEVCRLLASAEVKLQPISFPAIEPAGDVEPVLERKVVFAGETYITPVYSRRDLGAGFMLVGPAIVEQLDTTTVVWPEQHLRVDDRGQLILTAGHGQGGR